MQISEYRGTNNPYFNFGGSGYVLENLTKLDMGRGIFVSQKFDLAPILCYN